MLKFIILFRIKHALDTLRKGLNNLRLPRRCTQRNLTEIGAKCEGEKLKSEGSTQVDEYIKNFDEELEAKKEEIVTLKEKISRLESELHAIKQPSTMVASDLVLLKGHENEFYPNEHRELLLLILESAIKNVPDGSRRQHILKDILSANKPTKAIQKKVSLLKTRLKGYKTLDKKTRQFLEELGFDITGEGKHYKATFQGDSRYVVSLPKTSSDHLVGRNLASEINTMLF